MVPQRRIAARGPHDESKHPRVSDLREDGVRRPRPVLSSLPVRAAKTRASERPPISTGVARRHPDHREAVPRVYARLARLDRAGTVSYSLADRGRSETPAAISNRPARWQAGWILPDAPPRGSPLGGTHPAKVRDFREAVALAEAGAPHGPASVNWVTARKVQERLRRLGYELDVPIPDATIALLLRGAAPSPSFLEQF